jgi:peptidoglycan/xylan/chitin deacetylase (PgdA/CDA1 family)
MEGVRSLRSLRRSGVAVLAMVALVTSLAACGGDSKTGAEIEWIPGTPPDDVALLDEPTATATDEQPAPADPTSTAEGAPAPTATTEVVEAITGRKLTAEELDQFKPNELGLIPVLEYHDFVADEDDEAQFARTIDDFRADLNWLYEHNFFIVPLRDVIANEIKAPAGKHPVALTFDDSYASQFRYLIGDDGSVTIDPDSAVGILEAMYAAHPDFGRGGFFAVIPEFCFDWQADAAEPEQTPYCSQKIGWLLDNGYEVGNHSRDHKSLYDLTSAQFAEQIGGAIEELQAYDPRVTADIIAMPFGDYPKKGHEEQREMLRNGFTYKGRTIQMLGALMVGSEPTVSPISSDWDKIYIPRIQAWDADAQRKFPKALGDAMSLDDWFEVFASDPARMYTSDGDPNTITVPEELPPSLAGTFDETKAEGKEIVRY